MSLKFDRFVRELSSLCIKHNLQLSTTGYDKLLVSNLVLPDQPIYGGIEDGTADPVPPPLREGMVKCDTCSTPYQTQRFDYCPYCQGEQ